MLQDVQFQICKHFKIRSKLNLTHDAISHMTPQSYMPSSKGQAERKVRVSEDLMKEQNWLRI